MTVPARPVPGNPVASDWGDVVHDGSVAMDFQAGTVEVALPSGSADGATAVTFPRPFAATPFVILGNSGTQGGNAAGGQQFMPMAIAATPTAFSARVAHVAGGTQALTCSLRWMAYGPRA